MFLKGSLLPSPGGTFADPSSQHRGVQLPLPAGPQDSRCGVQGDVQEVCGGVRRGPQHRWAGEDPRTLSCGSLCIRFQILAGA